MHPLRRGARLDAAAGAPACVLRAAQGPEESDNMKLGERVYVRDTGRHAKLVAWIDGMPLVQYDDGSTYLAHRVEPIMRESDMEQQGQETLF